MPVPPSSSQTTVAEVPPPGHAEWTESTVSKSEPLVLMVAVARAGGVHENHTSGPWGPPAVPQVVVPMAVALNVQPPYPPWPGIGVRALALVAAGDRAGEGVGVRRAVVGQAAQELLRPLDHR